MLLPNANTTYIQNNFYGSSAMATPCMSGNNFYNGSLFGLGFGCTPAIPSFGCMPSFGYIPSFPMMGGCCGGYSMYNFAMMNRYLDMFTLLNTFNTTTSLTNNLFNSLSRLTTSIKASKNTDAAKKAKEAKDVQKVKTAKIKTETKQKTVKEAGYNAEKGAKLAKIAAKNATGFHNKCAMQTRINLEEAGLGNGERGDGYEYAGILSRNNNFKEIDATNLNLSKLPGGCALVYDKGVSGYSNAYGHVEITLGNGQAVSDGVTNNIKKGARVFVPV